MLQEFYDMVKNETTPIIREISGSMQQESVDELSPEILAEYQNLLVSIGDILEKKYHICDDSPVIHLLETCCEVLYQMSQFIINEPGNPVVEEEAHKFVNIMGEYDNNLQNSVRIQEIPLSIVAIMKNEGKYIEEFLCYHSIVGVEHFYLYDNESTDDTREILKPYIDKGLVTLMDYPGDYVQKSAYEDALRRFEYDTRYMAFIDLDEFIVPTEVGRCIPEIVDEIIEEHNHRESKWKLCGGIGVNWLVFGTSHFVEPPNGLVTESFLYRAENQDEYNSHIKVIVNPRVTSEFPKNSHNVTYISDNYSTISERGSYLYDSPMFFDASYEQLRIHHYVSKSENEFLDKICHRGWPDQTHIEYEENSPEVVKRMKLAKGDWNSVYDDTMLQYSEEIKKRIEGMRDGKIE